jgi:hypothetical protein
VQIHESRRISIRNISEYFLSTGCWYVLCPRYWARHVSRWYFSSLNPLNLNWAFIAGA